MRGINSWLAISGVFKGALCEAPPLGRTAVIFVTILGLFLAPLKTKLLPPVTRCVFWPENALKCVCVCGNDFVLDIFVTNANKWQVFYLWYGSLYYARNACKL